jgi:hypothetical protein
MIKRLTRTVPPLRGPNPQGLNIPDKKVKIVKSTKSTKSTKSIKSENLNGRRR